MPLRRVLAVLESRATYGYSKNIMQAMRRRSDFELLTLVTGMHLIAELGSSVDLIRADGFPITATVPLASRDDTPGAWPRAMGQAMTGFAETFERLKPDIVLLFGDRAETFTCCVAASYMSIPTAHVQAGDKSGHIDDIARMAMAKLAHIHLASCEDSAERLRRMGEQDFRIFNVGAPQLDDIVGIDYDSRSVTVDGGEWPLTQPYILVVQHGVLSEREQAAAHMNATLKAAMATGLPIILIFPNSDPGYRDIISVIDARRSGGPLRVIPNVERSTYLTLLANAALLLGNSSSGILEAPSFRVPVVNIGNRQRGRPQASNIINCGYAVAEISSAIDVALNDGAFRARCRNAVNPYGDGRSSARICDVLASIALDSNLIDKETVY